MLLTSSAKVAVSAKGCLFSRVVKEAWEALSVLNSARAAAKTSGLVYSRMIWASVATTREEIRKKFTQFLQVDVVRY